MLAAPCLPYATPPADDSQPISAALADLVGVGDNGDVTTREFDAMLFMYRTSSPAIRDGIFSSPHVWSGLGEYCNATSRSFDIAERAMMALVADEP